MSDPLSIAKAIEVVATTGFQIAQGLYKIADGIGSAGIEVRAYSKDISSFSKVLRLIKDQVLRPVGVTADELSLVKDITDICEEVLAPLEKLQATLSPLLERYKNSNKKLKQIGKRVQWYFSQKQKLLFYREALRGHQQNLELVLAAMNYTAIKDMPSQIALQNTLSDGPSTERGFHVARVQIAFQSPAQAGAAFQIESGSRVEEDPSDLDQNEVYETEATPTEHLDSQNITTTFRRDSGDDFDDLTGLELQEIDDAVESNLDPDQGTSAMILLEDIRVISRKTKRFAETILKSTELNVDSQSSFTMPTSSGTSNHTSNHGESHSGRESRTNFPTTLEVPESGRKSMESGFDTQTSQAGDSRQLQTITLNTPGGDLFEVPLEQIRSWRGLQTFIMSVYFKEVEKTEFRDRSEYREFPEGHFFFIGGESVLYNRIAGDHFILKGPQNQILLPSLWAPVVQPWWQISLSFKDPELNRRLARRGESSVPKVSWWKKLQNKF